MQGDSQTKAPRARQCRELVILSGKGGTGKTSVTGGFSHLAEDAVLCDCDVDAANLGLLLHPQATETHPFYASKKAHIDTQKCSNCGKCREVCRFEAIMPVTVNPANQTSQAVQAGRTDHVNRLLCEGCGFCFHVCPEQAVTMEEALSGHWYVSDTEHGPLVHARLEPGEGNSGKLVSAVRLKARDIQKAQGKAMIITDGPPGTGCPVIACISGADLALIVTEPTLSGISDLERIVRVCHHFRVPALICINKYDIDLDNTETIKRRAGQMNCPVAGQIPYDHMVPKAMVSGVPATAYDCPAGTGIRALWDTMSTRLLSDD